MLCSECQSPFYEGHFAYCSKCDAEVLKKKKLEANVGGADLEAKLLSQVLDTGKKRELEEKK